MKCRDKHRQDKVPGATYQSCLSKLGVALRGHQATSYQLLQEQGQRETFRAGVGTGLGKGTQGDRDFQDSAPRTWQERGWKLYFSVWFVYLSLVIYLVFSERSLGGDFNIVKFVEML